MSQFAKWGWSLWVLTIALYPSATYAADTSGKSALASKILGSYLSGIGVSYTYPATSYDLTTAGNSFYKSESSTGIESIHDMSLGLPMGTLHGYGNLAWRNGTTDYYYRNGHDLTPTTGSGVQYTAFSFEFASGPRFRPFPYFFISPLIGAGVGVGLLRTEFSDPNLKTKLNGTDYSWINTAGFYQAYYEVGFDLRLGLVGVEALYRRKYWRIFTSDTLPSTLWGYFQDDLVLAAIFEL